MSVIIKTEPVETEATTVLPDPGCGPITVLPDPGCGPIKGEDFLVKEEEEQQNVFQHEVEANC